MSARRSTHEPVRTRLVWRTDEILANLVVGLVVAVLLVTGLLVWERQMDAAAVPTWDGLPPCATEDSPGPCYWDAEHRGNGLGQSFVVIDDEVIPVCTDAIADAGGICWGEPR